MIFVNGGVVLLAALALRTLFHAQAETAAYMGFAEPTLLTRLLLCAVLQPLCIFLHECGHLAAGLALDQRCRRFTIGPVQWSIEDGRPRIRFILPTRAGVVDLVPSTFACFRQQRAIVAAAGPFASILSGLFLTAVARRAPNGEAFWVLSFAALCSVAAAVELIPMRQGSACSDGMLVLEAIRGGAIFDQVTRNFLPLASNWTPLRFRDWPEDLVARLAEAPADDAAQRYNAYLAYLHHQDRNDSETAGKHLDKMLATSDPQDPPEYALEAAYVFGFQRRDAEKAAGWLERVPEGGDLAARSRAEAAVEWARGNPARSKELAGQAIELCGARHDSGSLRFSVELLWELQQESAVEPAAVTAA